MFLSSLNFMHTLIRVHLIDGILVLMFIIVGIFHPCSFGISFLNVGSILPITSWTHHLAHRYIIILFLSRPSFITIAYSYIFLLRAPIIFVKILLITFETTKTVTEQGAYGGHA